MFPKSADQLSLSVFPEFSHYYDFDHVTRSICSPQSNRITQRAACTVQPMLSKSKTINSWLMESDLMAKSYNSSLKSQDQVFSCNKPKDKKTCSYICKGIVTKGERFVSGYTPTVQAFKKEKTTQQKQQLTYCQNRALEREKEIGSWQKNILFLQLNFSNVYFLIFYFCHSICSLISSFISVL